MPSHQNLCLLCHVYLSLLSFFVISFQAFFALVIGAFALGQAAPNAESLMTAAGSSVSIYETIDRVCLLLVLQPNWTI